MRTPDARKLIGKLVAWDDCIDPNRGTYVIRVGRMNSITGKNIEIDGDYKWLPNLVKFREATDFDKERRL